MDSWYFEEYLGDKKMAEQERLKNIQKAQILSQQLRALEDQLQILERRKTEIKIALDEIKRAEEKGETTVYQFLGANILIKKDIPTVKSELEEELALLENRINLIKRQLDVGKKELDRILRDLGLTRGTSGGSIGG